MKLLVALRQVVVHLEAVQTAHLRKLVVQVQLHLLELTIVRVACFINVLLLLQVLRG